MFGVVDLVSVYSYKSSVVLNSAVLGHRKLRALYPLEILSVKLVSDDFSMHKTNVVAFVQSQTDSST